MLWNLQLTHKNTNRQGMLNHSFLVAIKYGGSVSVRYEIIPELGPDTHLHANASLCISLVIIYQTSSVDFQYKYSISS
jgi:hypothetical protein